MTCNAPDASTPYERHFFEYQGVWADDIYLWSKRKCRRCGIVQMLTTRPVRDNVGRRGPRTDGSVAGYDSGQAMPLKHWRVSQTFTQKELELA